jgi:competence protein ComGC
MKMIVIIIIIIIIIIKVPQATKCPNNKGTYT